MSKLLSAAGRILNGFLGGIGFAIAFCLIAYGISWTFSAGSSTYTSSESLKFSPESGLRILSHEPVLGDEKNTILGEITNDGEHEWEDVSLRTDYFDARGKFIDQCENYVRGKIFPHTQVNFKASCDGCSVKSKPTKYATYKISIISARSDEMVTVTKTIEKPKK